MLIIGNNIFSIRVAKLLEAKVLSDWRNLSLLFVERRVLFIGLGFSPSTGWKRFFLLIVCLILRRQIYGYFIGSDLLRFKSSNFSRLVYWFIQKKIKVFVETDEMRDLACSCGVKVSHVQTYQTISPDCIQKIYVKQADQVISAYVGQKNQSFYRVEKILDAARQLVDFKFILIGDAPVGQCIPNNVLFTGWVHDMSSIYRTSEVFIRIPLSDGLGLSAYEALASDCKVVSSTNKPHCFLYNPHSDLVSQIKLAYCMQVDFDTARKYISDRFSEEKVKKQLLRMLG